MPLKSVVAPATTWSILIKGSYGLRSRQSPRQRHPRLRTLQRRFLSVCANQEMVLSGGFVEHFDDSEAVVRRHVEFVKPGGLVVIIVPNLTHIHRVLCGLLEPKILAVHRFPLMRKNMLRHTLEAVGLQVLHCEYHKTFRPTYDLPPVVDYLSQGVQKLLRIARLDDVGNPYGSPYLI
jgi:hypothetical protein